MDSGLFLRVHFDRQCLVMCRNIPIESGLLLIWLKNYIFPTLEGKKLWNIQWCECVKKPSKKKKYDVAVVGRLIVLK